MIIAQLSCKFQKPPKLFIGIFSLDTACHRDRSGIDKGIEWSGLCFQLYNRIKGISRRLYPNLFMEQMVRPAVTDRKDQRHQLGDTLDRKRHSCIPDFQYISVQIHSTDPQIIPINGAQLGDILCCPPQFGKRLAIMQGVSQNLFCQFHTLFPTF